jgi:ferredoxin
MPARALRRLESALDAVFGSVANPLRQLGALATLAFWIALASGAWIYAGFDPAPTGAARSLAALEAHAVNGFVRSLHRYAADAFVLLMFLHLATEWIKGRYRGFRWFTWLTGVPLLPLALATGLVGYWLAADARSQFVAISLGEWLGALPGVGSAMVRNFVTPEAIGDRLFSLLLFIHIGIGLIILLGLWVHLTRLVRPQVTPPRAAALSLAAALGALCVAWPALSEPVADFARVPTPVPVDWLVAGVLPFMHVTSPTVAWIVVGIALALLAALPWLFGARRARAAPTAVVDPAHCNGCGRCFDDCPYGAVLLLPRLQGRSNTRVAQVRADQCAGCGVCVGACPSATPLRPRTAFAPGIDVPLHPLAGLRLRLAAALESARDHGQAATVRIECEQRLAEDPALDDASEIILSVPCSAALPPAFVEYAQRLGARRVTIADCGMHGCEFRFGARFTRDRLRGAREPYLRPQARGSQVRITPDDATGADGCGLFSRPTTRAFAPSPR